MSVHKRVCHPGIYFITFTCYKWLSLIELTKGYDLVYNWFDVMKKNGNCILGYVIMPNHVHVLLHYTTTSQSLNTIVGNGKRFIGYEIISRLKISNEVAVLNHLRDSVRKKDRLRNKKHQVWQGTFDIKECRTERFILQKLNYIHKNPCRGKWMLSDRPYDYIHCSAKFYDGDRNTYMVMHYLDVLSEKLLFPDESPEKPLQP